MESNNNNSLLGIGEAAEYLGVSKDTLRRWERDGKLTPFRTPGNQRRYSLMLLREILRKRDSDSDTIDQKRWEKPKEAQENIALHNQDGPEEDTPPIEKPTYEEVEYKEDVIVESTPIHEELPKPVETYQEENGPKEEPYLPHPPFISDLEKSISESLNQVKELMNDMENSNQERGQFENTKQEANFRKFYQPKKNSNGLGKRLVTSIAASLVALGLIALGMGAVAFWSEKSTSRPPTSSIVSPLP